MQYILTQEEFDNIIPKSKYEEKCTIHLFPLGEERQETIPCEGYEIVKENGKFYMVKPTYPKTYEECCKIIDYHLEGTTIIGYEKSLLENFQKLLICRDAYWKIAGKQMGLGKSWEPEWNRDKPKYVIYPYQYLYSIDKEIYRNTILAFPTQKMREAFYENFKDLIEQCKMFL